MRVTSAAAALGDDSSVIDDETAAGLGKLQSVLPQSIYPVVFVVARRRPLSPEFISAPEVRTESSTSVEAAAICPSVLVAQTHKDNWGDVGSPSFRGRVAAGPFSFPSSAVAPIGILVVLVPVASVAASVVTITTAVVALAVVMGVAFPAVLVAASGLSRRCASSAVILVPVFVAAAVAGAGAAA